MMLTEHDWYPPLDDLPEAGLVLLRGIRALVPDVVAHIRAGQIDQTAEVAGDVDLAGSLGRSRFILRGSGARSVVVGARDALIFEIRGRATIAGVPQSFSGSCTVDIATSALLDLRLSTPVEI